jgi:hypothetical protein
LKTITLIYILNSILLLLHEIESAYEKEWEILNLPGKLTGFLLLHIPILYFMFYGILEIEKLSTTGIRLGIIFGTSGIIPFLVHKMFVKRKGRFNSAISNIIIFLNIFAGVALVYLSIRFA